MNEHLDETELYESDSQDRALRLGVDEERQPGDQVGPYRIVRPIGKGGMGEVYEGFDERLERPVALKRIKPSSRHGEQVRERFRREALAVAKLRHAAVVQVYDWVQEETGDAWIVMELVEGRSLRSIIDDGPLDPILVIRWARELVGGLAFAHEAGIVHRDLKADNVMITPQGAVKILDFGLAKRRDLSSPQASPETAADGSGAASGSRATSPSASGAPTRSAATRSAPEASSRGAGPDESATEISGSPWARSGGRRHRSPEASTLDFDDSGELSRPSRFDGPETTSELTAVGQLVGTVSAMSPEQAMGDPVDHRSDLFAIGSLFYEMLTGRSPFKVTASLETLTRICTYRQPPVVEVEPGVPLELSMLIDRLLRKRPERRPQSAAEVAAVLDDLLLNLSSAGEWTDFGALSSASIALPGSSSVAPPPAPAVEPVATPRTRWLLAIAVSMLAGALLASRAQWFHTPPAEPIPLAPVRVVVLPFQSLGAQPETYFATGLGEEIGRRLGQVEGLAVVSSTSASRLAASGMTLGEIGKALEADYALEGNVFWSREEGESATSSESVRVTPRLVRVDDESTVWNGIYERQRDQSLDLQADIASRVVDQLRPTLAPEEAPSVEAPTESSNAYFAYLRGLDYLQRPTFSSDELDLAQTMFELAVEQDPEFLESWVELVHVHASLYLNGIRSAERREAARHALERAEAIRPEAPEVRLARATFLYRVVGDYAAAAGILQELEREQSHSAAVISLLGYVQRRRGQLTDAVINLRRSFGLDRANAELATQIAETYRALRNFDAAYRWGMESLAIAPDQPWLTGQLALYRLYESGCDSAGCSTVEAQAILAGASLPDDLDMQYSRLLVGLYGTSAAIDRRAHLEQVLAGLELAAPERWRRYIEGLWRQMWLERELGRPERARLLAEGWRQRVESELEAAPDDGWAHAVLAFAQVFLGDSEAAMESARKSAESSRNDRFSGVRCQEWQMIVAMLAGEHETALDLLEKLLATQYQLAVTDVHLHLDPFWDPIRDHPRFRALLERRPFRGSGEANRRAKNVDSTRPSATVLAARPQGSGERLTALR